MARSDAPWPPAKKQLTIRLDEDVLDWLKGHGKGYQTRINRILRVVMESQPPPRARGCITPLTPPDGLNGSSAQISIQQVHPSQKLSGNPVLSLSN